MNLATLISDFRGAAAKEGFRLDEIALIGDWPILGLIRRATGTAAKQIYISAGIHGDEPAGPLALLEMLKDGSLPRENHYWICPLLNPTGMARGSRENHQGIDLNRDYSGAHSEEIQAHLSWVQSNFSKLDLCLHLHEDWESQGFYLYELNFTAAAGKADLILEAVRAHLPIEDAEQIDGSPSKNGKIQPESLPQVEGGDPEAIYFQKQFGGLNYTLETPSAWPLEERVEAHKAAVLAAIGL